MKRWILSLGAVVLSLGLFVGDAEAKRLGGGKSSGMQRENVTQKQATPQTPPAQQAAAPAAAPQPAPAAAAAAQPKRNWLGPIAGLAAGIGLAALLSHFGLGEGVANFLMILLLVMAAFFVFRLIFAKRQAAASPAPLQYAGVGGNPGGAAPAPLMPAATGSAAGAISAGFDVEGFLRVAKLNFIRLQAANDARNLNDLREFLTPELFAEVRMQIQERGDAPQETDVVALDAQLLEVVSDGGRYIASVRFSGTIREEAGSPAEPFAEVWNLVKPEDGSQGWMVAGIQQVA